MSRTISVILMTAAASFAIAACGTEPVEGSPTESPTVMENVTQACTPEGHRLYKYRSGYKGGLAVVPNDPTCPRRAS